MVTQRLLDVERAGRAAAEVRVAQLTAQNVQLRAALPPGANIPEDEPAEGRYPGSCTYPLLITVQSIHSHSLALHSNSSDTVCRWCRCDCSSRCWRCIQQRHQHPRRWRPSGCKCRSRRRRCGRSGHNDCFSDAEEAGDCRAGARDSTGGVISLYDQRAWMGQPKREGPA